MSITRLQTQILSYENKINNIDSKIKTTTSIIRENKSKFDERKRIYSYEPYDNSKIKLYQDKWLNLSFNKINIYKDLNDEFNEDFIWIDLDTIITKDISYINDLSNVFIENGGKNIRPCQLFKIDSIYVLNSEIFFSKLLYKLLVVFFSI